MPYNNWLPRRLGVPRISRRARGAVIFDPTSVPGMIGWYSANHANTITLGTDDEVTAVSNLINGGAGLVASPDGGPTYVASHPMTGKPALVWPDMSNRRGLELGFDAPVVEIFVRLAFRDGVVNSFPEFNTITTDIAGLTGGSTNRLMGDQWDDHLYAPSIPSGMHFEVDGIPTVDRTILPLPMSTLRMRRDTPFSVTAFGARNGNTSRSWQGPIEQIMAFTQPVSAANATSIYDFMAG